MTDLFKQLLRRRGLDESFLHPKYEDLFNPYELRGVQQAVERVRTAREVAEKIIIYGDYDADGVTASTLMCDALKYYGCKKVEVILPNRFTDGYGLNMPAVDKIAKRGAKLVITVDCGSGSEEVIAELKRRGIDAIVTDHHEIPKAPQSAVAVINPKSGDKVGARMAGVGVAFALARALNMDMNGGKKCDGQEKWLLDLVVIGTICDSMELREENRILSYYGMKVLSKTRRSGIRELARMASVDLARLDAHAIGFQLGPRINAAGRMKSADLALDLMMSSSRTKAFSLANELDALNGERRRAQEKAIEEIEVSDEDDVIVACGKWHEGILGIIAGRLVEIYKKPAFALTELPEGRMKGSGRSFGEFSLAEALQACGDLILSGGGHAGACGVSIRAENLDAFRAAMNKYYKSLKLKNQEKYLQSESDLEIKDLSEVTEELYAEFCLLEPFGDGNTEPILEFAGQVTGIRLLKDKHLSLTLRDKNNKEMKMVAFYAPEDWKKVTNGEKVRVQFTIMKNEWRGDVSIEGSILSLERL